MDIPKKIEGDRVYIKAHEKSFEYATKIYNLVDKNREHILPWLTFAMPERTKRAEDSYDYLALTEKLWEDGKEYRYGIFLKDNDELIGTIGANNKNKGKNTCVEFGFWLGKDYCSNGYVQEAMKLLEPLFKDFKRMIIRNDVDNIGSANVAKALGYEFEGISKSELWNEKLEQFRDINVFSKINP